MFQESPLVSESISSDGDYDPGAMLAITITLVVTIIVNIMLLYGVWRKKLACIFPFFILYSGLIIECIFAFIVIIIGIISTIF